jgi:pilus assembly protein CpaB
MRSRLIILIVALALGVTGAIVTSRYLQAEQARIAQGAQLVTVLVAQQDLPAGMTSEQLLSKGYLTQRQVPRQYVAATAVSSRAMLDGKVVAQPISKDQQVTASMFKYAADVGLASSTPKDYVAVAIPYDAARGVGNLLRPGDSVAVFATFEPGSKGVETAVTKLILPKAKVLAVDQTLDPSPASTQANTVANDGNTGSLASNGSQRKRAPNPTLTLALTPADAEKVVFAQEEGKVWLGLYSPTDLNTPVNAGVRYRQVVR